MLNLTPQVLRLFPGASGTSMARSAIWATTPAFGVLRSSVVLARGTVAWATITPGCTGTTTTKVTASRCGASRTSVELWV